MFHTLLKKLNHDKIILQKIKNYQNIFPNDQFIIQLHKDLEKHFQTVQQLHTMYHNKSIIHKQIGPWWFWTTK